MKAVTVITLSRNLGPQPYFDLYTDFNGAINAIKERYKDKLNVKVFLGDIREMQGKKVQRITVEHDGQMVYDEDGNEAFVESMDAMYAMVELPIV